MLQMCYISIYLKLVHHNYYLSHHLPNLALYSHGYSFKLKHLSFIATLFNFETSADRAEERLRTGRTDLLPY